MFHVVLHQPEIPPNTGNVIRLCANAGAALHLIKPLAFHLSDRALARAGLDYHDLAVVSVHETLDACLHRLAAPRVFAVTTHGDTRYDNVSYARGDVLLFGAETRGLPQATLDALAPTRRLRLPMHAPARSLNLSNAVAIVLYEAWRQHGFAGGA